MKISLLVNKIIKYSFHVSNNINSFIQNSLLYFLGTKNVIFMFTHFKFCSNLITFLLRITFLFQWRGKILISKHLCQTRYIDSWNSKVQFRKPRNFMIFPKRPYAHFKHVDFSRNQDIKIKGIRFRNVRIFIVAFDRLL